MAAQMPAYFRLLAGTVTLAIAASAEAQSALRGRVVDSETGTPLSGATVQLDGNDRATVTSDANGVFSVTLPAQGGRLSIRLIGYTPGDFRVSPPQPGEIAERVFALDFNGHQLPDVVVRARAEQLMQRYIDFESRRARKLGAFFRWDEIRAAGFNTVGDALRSVRGVRIQCDQASYECRAVMARNRGCTPTWWIDGQRVGSFHENTPIRDIYGIEVFRGAGEIPGEFGGSTAGCGVIALWTKSRPFR